MAGLFAFNSKNNLQQLRSIYVYYTSDCRNNLKKNILSNTTLNCQIVINDFTTSIHFCVSVFETFIIE